jgi:hypothetical protein
MSSSSSLWTRTSLGTRTRLPLEELTTKSPFLTVPL